MAEVAIDAALVGAMLHEQHPDLAHLPLDEVGGGWDNRLFRLGDHLLVRLRGYPWAWSVVPWFAGETLLRTVPADPGRIARALAAFLRALHQPAPADAPANPWRGVPLAARTPQLDVYLERVGGSVDRKAVLALWQEAVTAAPWRGPAVWIHGDLHSRNLLAAGGRLSAVSISEV